MYVFGFLLFTCRTFFGVLVYNDEYWPIGIFFYLIDYKLVILIIYIPTIVSTTFRGFHQIKCIIVCGVHYISLIHLSLILKCLIKE